MKGVPWLAGFLGGKGDFLDAAPALSSPFSCTCGPSSGPEGHLLVWTHPLPRVTLLGTSVTLQSVGSCGQQGLQATSGLYPHQTQTVE